MINVITVDQEYFTVKTILLLRPTVKIDQSLCNEDQRVLLTYIVLSLSQGEANSYYFCVNTTGTIQ